LEKLERNFGKSLPPEVKQQHMLTGSRESTDLDQILNGKKGKLPGTEITLSDLEMESISRDKFVEMISDIVGRAFPRESDKRYRTYLRSYLKCKTVNRIAKLAGVTEENIRKKFKVGIRRYLKSKNAEKVQQMRKTPSAFHVKKELYRISGFEGC
jgi:hypothetical protein